MALLPGISGKMYKGVKERKHDEWQNSGFGYNATKSQDTKVNDIIKI
ncbi:hypothetical protein [Sulfurimonas sp. CVO]|nr:hypothetical protein [Sulfurimonas sp. CVO]